MKVLVLGATGQLGSNLVRALLAKGDQVRALIRASNPAATLEGLDLERRTGDLNDPQSLVQACQGIDVVYHAAGYYPEVSLPGEAAKAQALKQTNHVLEAVRVANVERLVFTSTLATIGFSTTPGQLANEDCPFTTDYPNNPYLAAKVAMEQRILQAAQEGMPAVVLNPTAFYGPYDSKPTSGTQLLMVAKRQMPAYLDGPINAIDVRDVAVAHIRAAERGRVGERYIIGNWNTTQKELTRLMAKVAGVFPPVLAVPFPLARLGSKVGEWGFQTVLHKKPPIPGFFVEVFKHFQHYDCSKGLRELDYPRNSVETALRDSLAWFKQRGYV